MAIPSPTKGSRREALAFYDRTGNFKVLNEQGAKVLSNGLMAVDTVESALFISGEIVEPDTYDFSNPCPPSAVRVANCDLVATADKSGKTPDFKTARSSSKLPDGFRVNRFAISDDDRKYANSLALIIRISRSTNRPAD